MLVRILLAVASGALAMFLLDPEMGRRRRALMRDKSMKYAHQAQRRVSKRSKDLRNRAKGLAHDLRAERRPEL